MAVLTSSLMESLLCLLVEEFLPLELTSRLAVHEVLGIGSNIFASESLGITVRGTTSVPTS